MMDRLARLQPPPQWALQQGRAGARRARGGVPAAEHAGAATDPPTPRGTRVRRTKLNESRCGLESSAATALLRVGWRLLKAPPLPPSAPSPPPVDRWGDQRPSIFLRPPTGARADVVAGTQSSSPWLPLPGRGVVPAEPAGCFLVRTRAPCPLGARSRQLLCIRGTWSDCNTSWPGRSGRRPDLDGGWRMSWHRRPPSTAGSVRGPTPQRAPVRALPTTQAIAIGYPF